MKRPMHETRHFKLVASLPCAKCGIEGFSQCAHANGYEFGKGLGKKAHYLNTFPLCCTRPGIVGCHQEHDLLIGMTNEEAAEATRKYIAWTHTMLGIKNEVI